MLLLMRDAIHSNLVDTERDFCQQVGFNETNLPKVKAGKVSFTVDQITKACELMGTNANWILGLEKTKKRSVAKDPLELIRAGLEMLETKGKK
jgi:hypothetical protein